MDGSAYDAPVALYQEKCRKRDLPAGGLSVQALDPWPGRELTASVDLSPEGADGSLVVTVEA